MTRNYTRVEISKNDLLSVEYPARYVGGEYGAVAALSGADDDPSTDTLVIALCFPDLYEIGMSNTAIKILYTLLNRLEGVQCERVFAPAPDFETVLRGGNLPLFTLESRIPLHECDVVAFSVGYELSATNILNVLDIGGIPLRREERGDDDPMVIAGGPAMTNPAPFGPFMDGVFIGEAEGVLPDLIKRVRDEKHGALWKREALPTDRILRRPKEHAPRRSRSSTQVLLNEHPNVWSEEHPSARRAIWKEFGLEPVKIRFPVPNMKIVQDHATVEIMRGCPQGCRFCSAGILYRPFRMKPYEVVVQEVEHLVHELGYRTITLSSLSSGDYEGIYELYQRLNERFADDRVAFALPSLRVNSMTMPLLEQINQVRKSGLTFAVETPADAGQRAVNKMVPLDNTVRILEEAERRGWRHAKLYFMIGLPVPTAEQQGPAGENERHMAPPNKGNQENGPHDEVDQILNYVDELRARTQMNYNVAVATFVPKPHTPFQWERQLSEEEALEKIMRLKRGLRAGKMKLGYQAPFQSLLEGLISRGDRAVADVIESAFRRGARLDAWEEHLNRDLWRSLIDADLTARILEEREERSPLPWRGVKIGTTLGTLRRERARARDGRLTEQCSPNCKERCGVCNSELAARTMSSTPRPLERSHSDLSRQHLAQDASDQADGSQGDASARDDRGSRKEHTVHADTEMHEGRREGLGKHLSARNTHDNELAGSIPAIIRFRKTGTAIYIAHLSVVNTFTRALLRADIPVQYTQGFHPKPKLDFAQPISTGVYSHDEYLRVWINRTTPPRDDQTNRIDGTGTKEPGEVRKSIHPNTASADAAGPDMDMSDIVRRLNAALPPGLHVLEAWCHENEDKASRKPLMSAYWGGEYLLYGAISDELAEYLAAAPEVALLDGAELDGTLDDGTLDNGTRIKGHARLYPESDTLPASDALTDARLQKRSSTIRRPDNHRAGLIIRIDRSLGKGRGLTKLLQGYLGEHPVRKGLEIVRLRSFARDAGTGAPIPYRRRFPEATSRGASHGGGRDHMHQTAHGHQHDRPQ